MKSIMHLFEELVKEKCGPNCVKILKILEGKENISEFILAEKLDMNINELRIMLYKLTENNLILSTRKKDKQKGWYVYYWTFNFKHAKDLLIKHKEEQLEELKNKLTNKEIPRYICPYGCVSMNLEDAMEIKFKCPECGSLLKLKEVKYNEEIIKKKIKEIEEELEKIRKAVIIEVRPKEKKIIRKKVKKKAEPKKKIKPKKKHRKKPIKIHKLKKIKPKKKSVKKYKKKSKKIKRKSVKKPKPKKKITKKPIKKPKKKTGLLGKIRRKIRF